MVDDTLPDEKEAERKLDDYRMTQEQETLTPEESLASQSRLRREEADVDDGVGSSVLGNDQLLTPEEQVTQDLHHRRQYEKLMTDQTGYGESPYNRLEEYSPEEQVEEKIRQENDYRASHDLPPKRIPSLHQLSGEEQKHRSDPTDPGEKELESMLEKKEDVIERTADSSERSLTEEVDKPPITPSDSDANNRRRPD